jgi:uncharacterized membrane protein YqhA
VIFVFLLRLALFSVFFTGGAMLFVLFSLFEVFVHQISIGVVYEKWDIHNRVNI